MSGSLGGAELQTILDTKKFEADLKGLESTVAASFQRMSGLSEGILPRNGGSFASGAASAKKALDPLKESIRGVANTVNDLKVSYELGDRSQDEFITGIKTVILQAKDLRSDLSNTSTEYGRLTNIVGVSARALTTAEGKVSKLGLSQQFLLGTTNKSIGVLRSFGGVLGGLSLVSAIKGSFDLATNLEQLNISFETILGSGKAASDLLGGLQDFAAKTPFKFPELAESAKSLAAFNVSADDIIPTLSRIGDISAGVGVNVGDLAEIYGKAKVQGRLFAEDINQLTGRGIPIIGELAKQFNVTEGEVKNLVQSGKVGFDNLEQAFVSLTSEGGKFYELTAKQSESTAGKISTLGDSASLAGERFIEGFLPSLTKTVEVATKVADGLNDMTPALRGVVTQGALAGAALVPLGAGLGGIVSAVPNVVKGLTAIRTASAALLAPPAGLFIVGALAATALGTAVYVAAQKHGDAAEKVSRLTTEAENIVPALDGVKTATSKQQLLGNIQTLAETMDGDAKTAFVSYAQTAVDSAKTTGEAVLGIMQGIAVARKSILEDAVRAQATLLKDLERNQQESQTQFNISTATGGTGKESQALARLQSDLAEARTLVTESEQAITKAVAAGNAEREGHFKQQLEQDKALVTQIIGEIGKELDNTPAGRLNYDTSQAEQATRDLRGLQGQLDELNQLVETGTSEQIEAYFSRGAEGALKLSASTEPAATGVAKVGKAGDDAAAGLDSAGTAGDDAATGISTAGTAADKTATQFETAMDAATAWATRLTREAQQNVKPAAEVIGTFKDRVVELQKEQERLAKAGLAGGKQYDLAEQKISLLTGAIDELSGSQGKAENSGNDLSTSLGQLADKSFHAGDAERERVAQVIKSVDAQRDADAAVKSVIGGVDAYTAKNREAQDRLENLTSVTEYYTREVESSYDPLDAQIKQNKTNITVLGDVVKAQSGWNERLKISNKDLPKTVDYTNDFSTALSKLNANAQDVTGAFDGVDDITGGMRDAAAEAKLLGEKFDSSGTETKLLEDKIKSLLERGFKPSSLQVQGLSEHLVDLKKETKDQAKEAEQAKKANEYLADVFSKLQDSASLTYFDLQDMRTGLEEIADGSDKAAVEAQGLLTELDKLDAARELAGAFEIFGAAATFALENIPDLSNEATGALGFLQGAGTAASDALKDGFNGAADVGVILGAGISGIADALGDDLTPEANTALKAVGGAVSGAASGFATGGPVGAAIGGVVGLIGGLITGFQDAGKAAEEEAQRAQKAFEDLNETLMTTAEMLKGLQQDAGQSAVDLAEQQGAKPIDVLIAQTQLDLLNIEDEYRKTYRTIGDLEDKFYQEYLAKGLSEGEARRLAREKTDPLRRAADENYRNTVALTVGSAEEAANKLGVADGAFAKTLATPSDILINAGVGLDKNFNEFTGIYQSVIGRTVSVFDNGTSTLSSQATKSADTTSLSVGGILDAITQVFGDKAGPIIDLINQTYADMGGAVDTSTTTLSTQATGSSTTVSGDLGGIFTSAQNAITATAPGATSALTTALSGIRTGLGNEGDPLARSLKDQEDALAERSKQLFLEQEIMAGKHGPEAKAALEAQLAAERQAIYDSVYGSGGLSPFLSTTQGALSGVLSSFFTTQGTTITNKGGGLVGDIDDIATKISRAMSGLASAAVPPKGVGSFSFSTNGGKGKVPALAAGGLVKRPTFALVGEAGPELVVPLNKLHGLIQTALGEMSVPVKGGFDVSGASKDIVRSISQAGKAEAGAYRAAGSTKASGIASETEQVQRALAQADKQQAAFIKKYGKKKVRANDEQKKAYAENKKALMAFESETFDLINGRALTGYTIQGRKDGVLKGLLGPLLGGKVNLIKGLTDDQQGVIDFAQQVGTSLEQSVFSGVSAGLKSAVKGGVPDLKGITEGIFDNVADSLIGKLQTQVLASALGPLLTDITADITRGNVAGAAKGVQKIAGKLPGLISNFQKLLSPLTGAYSALGLGQKEEAQRGEVITIESPIADLSSITELLSQTRSLTTPGAISQTALSGAAPTITALPSYQAQQEAMNVPMFNTAVNRFDSATVRFERSAARLELLFKSRGNAITDAARGKGVSAFNLT